ncbi:MAG: hypothetical protein ACFFCQ_00840 [Promethearchaeota archaeon]
MVTNNGVSNCHYYSPKGYCSVLKVNLSNCPMGCPFFFMKDPSYEPTRELLDDCRLLQYKGLLTICCEKGEVITSCAGCLNYDVLDNYDLAL